MDTVDRLITRVELQGEAGVVRGLTRMGGVMQSFSAAAVAGATLNFLKDSVQSFIEAEDVASRFAQTMKSVGTNYPVQEAQNYATALEHLTTFSDEEILSSMQLLGTYKLTRSQIEGLTPLILDAATALKAKGVSAEQLAVQLAKAYSTGNLGALTRFGILVDQTKFKQDRLKAITDALSQSYGGMAEAMSKTTGGQLQQLAQAFDDLKEAIGGDLATSLKEWTPILIELTRALIPLAEALNKVAQAQILMVATLSYVEDKVLKVFNPIAKLFGLEFGSMGLDKVVEAIGALMGKTASPGTPGATDPNAPGAAESGFKAATRTFLGGGAIGRIGMAASELPDIRARSSNSPVVVRIEGDTTFEQVVNKVLAQLTRHGVIRPATG